jgi:hypothetical protein
MRNFTLLVVLTALFAFNQANAQNSACTVSIRATDTVICAEATPPTLTATAYGPDVTLMASNTAGNNHRGNMFDIVATNEVTILSFDASPMGATTVEVYYKAGTWNGFANTPSAWTYLGSALTPYTGGFSFVDVPVNVTIPAGQTYAFYVTSNTSAVSLNYSNGTNVGNVYSSDANITFIEGGGLEYPFTQNTGAVYQPRVWNGNIHYATTSASTTYLWSTAATTQSITPATVSTAQYTVESTIPGCLPMYDTLDITVSLPVVTASSAVAVCAGELVTLHGEGAETYAWTGNITDSVAFEPAATMEYFVTGTDTAGCTAMDSVEITVHQLPLVFAGTDYSVCPGTAITLAGQGEAVDYEWNNGVINNQSFVPVAEDEYVVTGTDVNGCIDSATITVGIYPPAVVSAGPDLDLCQGVEHTLNGTGTDTYDWDNGVTDGTPFIPENTTYTVIGTDTNGCVDSDEMTVTLHNVMASIFASGTTLTAGTLVDMTAQWINCSDLSEIQGETDVIYQPELTGSYAIVVSDNVYGCMDTSNCVLVDFTGIAELTNSGTLEAYPVPTNGTVTIVSSGEPISRIELVDLLGNVLQSGEPKTAQTELDLSAYAANQFFVRVYRQDTVEMLKVIKQ